MSMPTFAFKIYRTILIQRFPSRSHDNGKQFKRVINDVKLTTEKAIKTEQELK